MMPYTPMSNNNPSSEARTVTDDRISNDESPRKQVYMSTADGDVVVIDPSFDADEKGGRQPAATEDRDSPQGYRCSENLQTAESGRTHPSPGKDARIASHARNLSAHFCDAARIQVKASPIQTSQPQGVSFDDHSKRDGKEFYPVQQRTSLQGQLHPSSSPALDIPPVSATVCVGQKHRRGLSGDAWNPTLAHRRINSIGQAAPVERGLSGASYGTYRSAPPQDNPYQAPSTGHHRKGSEGLDMLSAAIRASGDVSKQELATAAGALSQPAANTSSQAEQPSEAPRSSPHSHVAELRTSPMNVGSVVPVYDYSRPHYQPAHPPHGYYISPPVAAPYQGYQQGHYYPPQAPPSHPAYRRQPSYDQTTSYPVQYAPPRGQEAYSKEHFHPSLVVPSSTPENPPTMLHELTESSGQIEMDEQLFSNRSAMHYHASTAQWGGPPRPATTTGSQTFVTTMSVGEGNKMIRPTAVQKNVSTNTDPDANNQKPLSTLPANVGHHRKMSSFSSLSTLMQSGLFPDDPGQSRQPPAAYPQGTPEGQAQTGAHHRSMSSSLSFFKGLDDNVVRGHHRSTSSSVSFLQGFEEGFDPNEACAQGVDGQVPAPFFAPNMTSSPFGSAQKVRYARGVYCAPPQPPRCREFAPREASGAVPAESFDKDQNLAEGGTSKRVRRKCLVGGCPNRVVQGGLCISHGAKRKTCKYPGCMKNVKKAGLCSTHGPARKRCDVEGCSKVAVQGGRCIAHGAKKKLCSWGGCKKQAILSGMCKKHHDETVASEQREAQVEDAQAGAAKSDKPGHSRGLSIFQEVSPENIQTILSEPGAQVHENTGQPDDYANYRRM